MDLSTCPLPRNYLTYNFFATSATLKQSTKRCRLAEIKTQKQMLKRCVSLELKTQTQPHSHNPVSALSSIIDGCSSTMTKSRGWEREIPNPKESSNDLGGRVWSEKPGSERNSSSLNSQLFLPSFTNTLMVFLDHKESKSEIVSN